MTQTNSNLILVRSDTGDRKWSLYPAGTTDKQIAKGGVRPLLMGTADVITGELTEYGTGEHLRLATGAEVAASLEAARHDNGSGIFTITTWTVDDGSGVLHKVYQDDRPYQPPSSALIQGSARVYVANVEWTRPNDEDYRRAAL